MAADILIYKSDTVPVGDDQKAHIDLTNEIAKKFNSMFGDTFSKVTAMKSRGERILSLKDPKWKMSKTGDEGIALTDTPDEAASKIKKAVTDSGSEIHYDTKGKPAISNLLTIYHLLSGESIDDLVAKYNGKSYLDFKANLAEVVVDFLKPFQEKRKEYEKNMDEVVKVLEKSEEKARSIASVTLAHVKEKMGLE